MKKSERKFHAILNIYCILLITSLTDLNSFNEMPKEVAICTRWRFHAKIAKVSRFSPLTASTVHAIRVRLPLSRERIACRDYIWNAKSFRHVQPFVISRWVICICYTPPCYSCYDIQHRGELKLRNRILLRDLIRQDKNTRSNVHDDAYWYLSVFFEKRIMIDVLWIDGDCTASLSCDAYTGKIL